jgi:hypothetical protein
MLEILLIVLVLAAVFGAVSMEGALRIVLIVLAVFLVFALFGRL